MHIAAEEGYLNVIEVLFDFDAKADTETIVRKLTNLIYYIVFNMLCLIKIVLNNYLFQRLLTPFIHVKHNGWLETTHVVWFAFVLPMIKKIL